MCSVQMFVLRHTATQPLNKYFQLSCISSCKRAYQKYSQERESSSLTSTKHFNKIYTFPYIRIAGVVNRLKVYQTVLTVLGVPSTLLLQWVEVIPYGVHEPVIGLGLTGTVVLYSIGLLCYKLVGAMYLSTDGSTVKISHLDFWGRRTDTICPVNDILPLSELSDRPSDPYINLKRYSTAQNLRLTLRYGKIVDTELFKNVFGDL